MRESVGWHFLFRRLLSAVGRPAWRTRCSRVHPKPLLQKGKLSPQEQRMELRRVPTRLPKVGASLRKTEGQRIPWRHEAARHAKIQRVRRVRTETLQHLNTAIQTCFFGWNRKKKKTFFHMSYSASLFFNFFYCILVVCVCGNSLHFKQFNLKATQ